MILEIFKTNWFKCLIGIILPFYSTPTTLSNVASNDEARAQKTPEWTPLEEKTMRNNSQINSHFLLHIQLIFLEKSAKTRENFMNFAEKEIW